MVKLRLTGLCVSQTIRTLVPHEKNGWGGRISNRFAHKGKHPCVSLFKAIGVPPMYPRFESFPSNNKTHPPLREVGFFNGWGGRMSNRFAHKGKYPCVSLFKAIGVPPMYPRFESFPSNNKTHPPLREVGFFNGWGGRIRRDQL